jgi:hypothetical protein
MTPTIGRFFLGRIELVFFAVVAVAVAGVFAYQALVIDPGQKCEASGNWWDPKTRTCGHVIYLPDITHRPIGSKAPRYPNLPQSPAAATGATSGVQ